MAMGIIAENHDASVPELQWCGAHVTEVLPFFMATLCNVSPSLFLL